MEAKMSLKSRKELLYRMQGRYHQADRIGKTEIIDGFVAATGYHRKYAASILASRRCVRSSASNERRESRRVYDDAVKHTLITIWNAANQICSKRLAPFMPEFVATLERFGHLALTDEIRSKLLKLSPASMDRLLKQERSNHPRGVSTTKPANLLKQRIKVRTYAQWDDTGPGFFEADLVAHCGDRVDGPFVNTLVLTDVATGWTEFVPLLRKSDADVIAGLETVRSVLPVPLFGLDTDNGCEFINYELVGYCERERITFTRSRAYKKNDQAHVEQKNGSVIRRIVGYDRFEGVEAVMRLLSLYRVLRLYVNFFQPSCKLLRKTRTGSKTSKEYDVARTPFQRMLESPRVSGDSKEKLLELQRALDPVDLFEQLGHLQEDLWKAAVLELPLPAPQKTKVFAKPVTTDAQQVASQRLRGLKPTKKYKRQYTSRVSHTWRTRPDPLAGTYEYAKLVFCLEPEITSTELLGRLIEKYPDKITGKELKTLQRRLAKWRREAMLMQISTYESDTKYDDLPFTDSLSQLTKKALNIAANPG